MLALKFKNAVNIWKRHPQQRKVEYKFGECEEKEGDSYIRVIEGMPLYDMCRYRQMF
jgi:hypothetical protein